VTAPRLLIRKRVQLIQGRMRPCCFVQAMVDDDVRALLEQHFLVENLFRRSSYASVWPEGTLKIPAAIAPAVSALLKNDACPEISVKTMLAGQMHQAATVWEMMSFELIAKIAFDNLVEMISAVRELDRDVFYGGISAPDAELALPSPEPADLNSARPQATAA
jgi:hypothetical protein